MLYHINLIEEPLAQDKAILKQLIEKYIMSEQAQDAF